MMIETYSSANVVVPAVWSEVASMPPLREVSNECADAVKRISLPKLSRMPNQWSATLGNRAWNAWHGMYSLIELLNGLGKTRNEQRDDCQ